MPWLPLDLGSPIERVGVLGQDMCDNPAWINRAGA